MLLRNNARIVQLKPTPIEPFGPQRGHDAWTKKRFWYPLQCQGVVTADTYKHYTGKNEQRIQLHVGKSCAQRGNAALKYYECNGRSDGGCGIKSQGSSPASHIPAHSASVRKKSTVPQQCHYLDFQQRETTTLATHTIKRASCVERSLHERHNLGKPNVGEIRAKLWD